MSSLTVDLNVVLFYFARFLVVIDDLQGARLWYDIQSVFQEYYRDSQIIVTTSIPSVADACSCGSYIYKMQVLSPPHSYELMLRKVCRSGANCTPALNSAFEEMLSKCDRSPLEIISMANYFLDHGLNLTVRKPNLGN